MNHPRHLLCLCLTALFAGGCSGGTTQAAGAADVATDVRGVRAPDAGPDEPSPDVAQDQRPTEEVPQCVVDEDCSPDLCEAGVCVPGCRYDGACGDGEICEALLCVEGCRNPADCPDGHTCRNRSCIAVGCRADTDCGGDARCVDDGCIEIGGAECEGDEDCGHRWRCASIGLCHAGQCLTHADCTANQWCREAICTERAGQVGDVKFQPVYPDHIAAHRSSEGRVYGTGGGLIDMDGDLDLDLFLGAWNRDRDSPPCLYRNVSTSARIAFEPVPELCQWDLGQVISAGAVDVDGDGREEMLLLGPGLVRLVRFHPEPARVDLLAHLEPDDPRRACLAGSYAATDLDLDGRVDLIVGCQAPKRPRSSTQDNLVLRQNAEGEFVHLTTPETEILASNGVTLALGILDVDEDGLLDIVVLNDTFIGGGGETNELTSGHVAFRCPPTEPCHHRTRPMGQDTREWGSFMGAGNIHIHGLGDHLYLTDWGPNRLVRYEDGAPVDRALDLGVDLGADRELLLFGWSALVDDFDRNGLDDVFVTQGMAVAPDAEPFQRHHDTVLLQREGPSFEPRTTEAGLQSPNTEDSGNPDRPYASRGGVKADLNLDGFLEILIAPLEGHVRLYTERSTADNAPDRCTLVPRPRVVPALGCGYAVSDASRSNWRRRDVHGHMRFGASSWILSSVNAGVLRFPSGAEVAFNCDGGPGPLVLEEPDWIVAERRGVIGVIRLDTPWLEGDPEIEVAVRSATGDVRMVSGSWEPDGWTLPLRDQDLEVMVRIGPKWVGRWLWIGAR